MSATSKPAGQRPGSRSPKISTIGEDLLITGNVTSKGEIHFDGELHGDIHCVSLVLGESSQLEGGVLAEDVVVRGRLKGSVRALRVTLQSKCHVEGDLIHQSLAIEQGAFFEGSSSRSEDPLLPSQEALREPVFAKPEPVAEQTEKHSDKSAAKFRRTF
ncbi:MAG: polymer-forming cytoskeletal protein [Methyloceanibacter sp.]